MTLFTVFAGFATLTYVGAGFAAAAVSSAGSGHAAFGAHFALLATLSMLLAATVILFKRPLRAHAFAAALMCTARVTIVIAATRDVSTVKGLATANAAAVVAPLSTIGPGAVDGRAAVSGARVHWLPSPRRQGHWPGTRWQVRQPGDGCGLWLPDGRRGLRPRVDTESNRVRRRRIRTGHAGIRGEGHRRAIACVDRLREVAG
jgi:hypothetical protein